MFKDSAFESWLALTEEFSVLAFFFAWKYSRNALSTASFFNPRFLFDTYDGEDSN
jgi:hypothetical protein